MDKKGYLWTVDVYIGKIGDTIQKHLGGSIVKNLFFYNCSSTKLFENKRNSGL